MIHLITGGAGCIGSELARTLMARGDRVRVIDNLSSGKLEHIRQIAVDDYQFIYNNLEFIRADIRDFSKLIPALRGVDTVWHLAAKTDIKWLDGYYLNGDYENNLDATWRLIRAMLQNGVKRLAFASSAAVYGNFSVLDEDVLVPEPISLYCATKLACEGIIRAIAERCDWRAWIFRFCSIVSGRSRTSGNMVIPDLLAKLRKDPTHLEILGDGKQCKPSLHVAECVEAMQFIVERARERVSIFNVGPHDGITVNRQAELIIDEINARENKDLRPAFSWTAKEGGGWPGDVHSFRMRAERLAMLGWRPLMSSEEACRKAIRELLEAGA